MAVIEERKTGDSTPITYHDFLRTGPGTLAGRYLRMYWQPVYCSADLQAGRAVPIRIMSEDFTLYRGEGGVAHLLAFRCAHRGTQLSTGWVEGDDLRCFYHGWKYGPAGQCIEQPAEPEPFCQRIRIRAYPVREYIGFVFAYLGEGDPPDFSRLPEFEHPEYVNAVTHYVWPVNYFTQLDNSIDQAHTAIAHWQFGRHPVKIAAQETEYGVIVDTVEASYRDPTCFCMPNSHEWASPPRPGGKDCWSYAKGWRVPIDDRTYARFGLDVVPLTGDAAKAFLERQAARDARITRSADEVAGDVLGGRMSPRELKAELFPDLVNIQDFIAQVGLGDIVSHPHSEHLGRSDVAVMSMRSLWTRELRALAEGRPLTQWRRPDTLWGDLLADGGSR